MAPPCRTRLPPSHAARCDVGSTLDNQARPAFGGLKANCLHLLSSAPNKGMLPRPVTGLSSVSMRVVKRKITLHWRSSGGTYHCLHGRNTTCFQGQNNTRNPIVWRWMRRKVNYVLFFFHVIGNLKKMF